MEKVLRRYGRGMKITETQDYIRLRVRNPKLFIPSSVGGEWGTQDPGRRGFTKRIAGQLKSTGEWATQALIFNKDDFSRIGAIARAKKFARMEMKRLRRK